MYLKDVLIRTIPYFYLILKGGGVWRWRVEVGG